MVQARRVERDHLICVAGASVLRRRPASSVQIIIADPPYCQVLPHAWDRQWTAAAGYVDWLLAWLAGAMRVLWADGLLYCFGQLGKREHTFLHLMSEAARRWQFHDLITWDGIGHARFRQLRLPQL